MSLKDELKKLEDEIDKVAADTANEDISDAEQVDVVEEVNRIEQKLAEILAAHHIEIGDERVD